MYSVSKVVSVRYVVLKVSGVNSSLLFQMHSLCLMSSRKSHPYSLELCLFSLPAGSTFCKINHGLNTMSVFFTFTNAVVSICTEFTVFVFFKDTNIIKSLQYLFKE